MSAPISTLSEKGFVIGRLPFGNTGLILRWLTPGSGRMSTMAKGAMKSGNSFGLQFDLYYLCEFEFIPARRGDLHTLKEVKLLEPNLGLRRHYPVLLTLEYFAALIEEMTEPGTPLPEDFDLFAKALEYLNTHEASRRVVERFENRILALHGLGGGRGADLPQALRQLQLNAPLQRQRLLDLLPPE
jgi:DNA repair protein RecO (recombination protein O)